MGLQTLSHKDPSFQINVISTNGDEITHTQSPHPGTQIATHHDRRESAQKSLSLTVED